MSNSKNKAKHKCSRCGIAYALREKHFCPAKNSRCHKCHKIGHWRPMCKMREKSLHQVDHNKTSDCGSDYSEASGSTSSQLDTISIEASRGKMTGQMASATIL